MSYPMNHDGVTRRMQQPSGESTHRSTNSGTLRWLVALTTLFAPALIAYHGYQLWSRSSEIQSHLKRISARGLPVDNASLEQWHRSQNHDTQSALWAEILDLMEQHLISYPSLQNLPSLGQAELPEVLDPNQPWREEPYVAEYLRYARPILDKLQQATQRPEPVWLPLEFRGFHSSLGYMHNLRSVMRLLALEVEYALYHEDATRAMQGLSMMKATSQSVPYSTSLVTKMIGDACEAGYHAAVTRSLQVDLWTEAQLEELSQQLVPSEQLGPSENVVDQWRSTWAGEQAMFAAQFGLSTGTQSEGLTVHRVGLARLQRVYLELSEELQSMATDDLGQLLGAAEKLEQSLIRRGHQPQSFDDMTFELLTPAVASAAKTFVKREEGRRQTSTALGIKRYQKRFGKWPKRLTDLTAIGHTAENWQTIRSGEFGYSAEADRAWLWSYRQDNRYEMVPEERPEEPSADTKENQPSFRLILIR